MVVGLCAGFQMLGRTIADPAGREGTASGPSPGLGLLEIDTEISDHKRLGQVEGVYVANGIQVRGYEMHMGVTSGKGLTRPMLQLEGGRPDGAVSADGQTMGCYVHGLFASDGFRHDFLQGLRRGRRPGEAYEARVDAVLDALAQHIEAQVDLDVLLASLRL
jgi:adenosylcobyric acid synthase